MSCAINYCTSATTEQLYLFVFSSLAVILLLYVKQSFELIFCHVCSGDNT